MIIKKLVFYIRKIYFLSKYFEKYDKAKCAKGHLKLNAIEDIEDAIQMAHKYNLLSNSEKAEIYYNVFSLSLSIYDLKKANKYIDLCIQNNNTESTYFVSKGIITSSYLKNNQQAIELHQHALQLDNQNAYAYLHLSKLFLKENKYEIALDYINKSIELQPDYHASFFEKSVCLFYLKQYSESEFFFHEYLHSPKLKFQSFLISIKGKNQFKKEYFISNFESIKSQTRFGRLIEQRESINIIRAEFLKGLNLMQKNQFEEALTSFHKIIKIDKKIRVIYTYMGYCFLFQKDLKSSNIFFSKAANLGCQEAKKALKENRINLLEQHLDRLYKLGVIRVEL